MGCSCFDLGWYVFVFLLTSIWNSRRKMSTLNEESVHIREVWEDNLDQEFELISKIVDDYSYVAMDTEFPGTVVPSVGGYHNKDYGNLKANVDRTKLIQVGLTFFDETGNLPTCESGKYCIWQFNFREFDLESDEKNIKSTDLLSESGIDFKKNNEKGVDAFKFSAALMSSGAILSDDVHWITFDGSTDFGYLLKLLIGRDELPDTQGEFFQRLQIYFPKIYDIKHLINFINGLHGGLGMVARILGVTRIGKAHQAGSDSLITSCIFMRVKEMLTKDFLQQQVGILYGFGDQG